MDQSDKGLNDRVKAMAMETFWVLEVILCWVVALPILLIAFLGFILWQKIEKIRLHNRGTLLEPTSRRVHRDLPKAERAARI